MCRRRVTAHRVCLLHRRRRVTTALRYHSFRLRHTACAYYIGALVCEAGVSLWVELIEPALGLIGEAIERRLAGAARSP